MKKVELWKCERCGKSGPNEEEIRVCEESHLDPLEAFVRASYLENRAAPVNVAMYWPDEHGGYTMVSFVSQNTIHIEELPGGAVR
jgi:hypothetical protein